MAIIKCKMCGGDIELTTDKTFGTCEFCGSTMTLPKIDDDQRAAAFNRGNHFRRIGEFDKALAVYERIVREDDTDAEAHWCCALCRFGIEYVEDPATYEYLPTCHRASFDSFLEDVDYLAAVEHSEGITKRQYQRDGAKIAEVQRGILATSQNAEPYDVFICYKESDQNGDRTRDSLMAQDIYYQLTEQGRKVFFARITLEDVAGTQYEPYIFAALNSAKVMIVVGTKPEHLNAVWVKNEWSRFLAMMKKDRHKLLLPCYRDMDPYDMPEQLGVLQSYDMSKIGFIQDLTRGIAKVLDAEKKPEPVKETVVVQQAAATPTAPLMQRAFMFLEDGEWDNADQYCEKVLDLEPQNAQAYLGKLMVELKVKTMTDLATCKAPFDQSGNYTKALRFADDELRKTLENALTTIRNRELELAYRKVKFKLDRIGTNGEWLQIAHDFDVLGDYKDAKVLAEQARNNYSEGEYKRALSKLEWALSDEDLKEAGFIFRRLRDYKDSESRLEQCMEKHLEKKYNQAIEKMKEAVTEDEIRAVLPLFAELADFRDARDYLTQCEKKIRTLFCQQTYLEASQKLEKALTREESDEGIRLLEEICDYQKAYDLKIQCEAEWASLPETAKQRWNEYQDLQKQAAACKTAEVVKNNALASLGRDLNAAESMLQRVKKQSAILTSLEQEIDSCQKQLMQTNSALASLGVFAFSQKRELNAKVAALNARIQELAAQTPALKAFLQSNASDKKLQTQVDELTEKIHSQQQQLGLQNQETEELLARVRKAAQNLAKPRIVAELSKDPDILPQMVREPAVIELVTQVQPLRNLIKAMEHFYLVPMELRSKVFKANTLDAEALYFQACQAMENASEKEDLRWALEQFLSISSYKDSAKRIKLCREALEGVRFECSFCGHIQTDVPKNNTVKCKLCGGTQQVK